MNALKQALFGTLTAGTTVTGLLSGAASVYDRVAPEGAAFPFVVFNQQASDVENLDANDRESYYVQVQGVTTTGFKDSWTIALAADALLHDRTLIVSGYTVIWQKRTARVEYAEVTGEGNYYHAGGIYQFRITK